MKKNMGILDRSLRIIAALAVGILYFGGIISGMLAVVLLVFATVFVLTSFIGFCPLYYPLGIKTCKTEGNKQ